MGRFLGALMLVLGVCNPGQAKEILVAEPAHVLGWLPIYVAIDQRFYEAEGVKVALLTTRGGAAHTNAVLSGEAFAFGGGTEHNAFAHLSGQNLRAVVNIIGRSNGYLVAGRNLALPTNGDLAGFVRGKRIAVPYFGFTPNSLLRSLLSDWKLDPSKDVQLLEMAEASELGAVRNGQADVAVISEPFLTQGVRAGVWNEPFLSLAQQFGRRASSLSVLKNSIDRDPETVGALVRGTLRALRFIPDNPDKTAEIARREFPTMPLEDLRATLARAQKDRMWSEDGEITREDWARMHAIVRDLGILKQDVAYEDVIDMRFVEASQSR